MVQEIITQQSVIPSNLIKPPTMSCKSLKNDPNISPADHSPDQPNILQISKINNYKFWRQSTSQTK